jgi:hypothetical protein
MAFSGRHFYQKKTFYKRSQIFSQKLNFMATLLKRVGNTGRRENKCIEWLSAIKILKGIMKTRFEPRLPRMSS